ncbi:MAG: AI-2E family transporter [Candidatus Eremiobacteraeota bacterium]|nr:AI-2E family transporter [Candidatus Eremiobacteraeota bacterium]MBC5804411.1 AI-2E family transporter [Candidatus Eremiobacteraeota bacterium]MBC5821366.1 AI-2E family transporter [Candidatus Eremiobacteraeota bacterium]
MVNEPFNARDRTNQRLIRALLIAGLALVVGGLLWMLTAVFDRVHNTLIVIIFSILFAYFVYPPIKWLAARRVPVALAGLIVYAVLAILVLGAIAWLSPAIASQAQALTRDFPHIVTNVQQQIADPRHSPLLRRLPGGARDAIAKNAGKVGTLVGGFAGVFGAQALAFVQGTTALLIDLALVLAITLLMVGDLANIQAFGVRLVPRAHRSVAISFMNEVDTVVGGFVRGQILLAVGVAVAGTIVLVAVGVPYGLLLGLLAGIASIVPMIGPIVAILPVLVIAFFTVGIVKTIVVVALYVVIIMVQQNVLVPVVVARSVGVTPLVIFIAVLLGSEAFGILGALLSLPIAGILRVVFERIFPPDPEADAQLRLARDRAGEPKAVTRKATGAES